MDLLHFFRIPRRVKTVFVGVILILSVSIASAGRMSDVLNSFVIYFSAKLTFSDVATGGSLILVNNTDFARPAIALETRQGETPQDVGSRIRAKLDSDDMSEFMLNHVFLEKPAGYYDKLMEVFGAVVLFGHPGDITIGGTETGLGILPPVGSLSARLDPVTQQYQFRWHEKSGYDDVCLRRIGGQAPLSTEKRKERSQTGTVDFYTIPAGIQRRFINRPLYVVGLLDGLPTNASHIIVRPDAQLDYFFPPFTNGITSNWTGWTDSQTEPIAYEERAYSEDWVAPKLEECHAEISRCAQIIRSDNAEGQGGLYRSFIAQTPGNIYRPSIRYRVMEEEADFEGEWAFDIMVGAIEFNRSYELDEATRIREADAWSELESSASQVRKWHFDQSMESNGDWLVSETGAISSDAKVKDIRIQDDKTAIFICVRLTGHKPNGIAMDGVRLMDVTDEY